MHSDHTPTLTVTVTVYKEPKLITVHKQPHKVYFSGSQSLLAHVGV